MEILIGEDRAKFVDAKGAAILLGLTPRHLGRLTKRGYFFREKIGKKYFYKQDDLIMYKWNKKVNVPVTRLSFTTMVSRLNRLATKIEAIERVLDLYYEPLELDIRELRHLYTNAQRKEFKKVEELKYWAEICIRLTEEHFINLRNSTEDERCWLPFYEICYLGYWIAKYKKKKDLMILFKKALDSLRKTILIFLQLATKEWGLIKTDRDELKRMAKNMFSKINIKEDCEKGA